MQIIEKLQQRFANYIVCMNDICEYSANYQLNLLNINNGLMITLKAHSYKGATIFQNL